ncbi:MAG: CocE/NonD family hydrolase [Theionarchaea archaeon]|nr:CocE/NonD family hydrolase [Theionarchaea archaeon]
MSKLSRLLKPILNLPPVETHNIVVEKDLNVPMRDRVVLLADHYTPRGGEGELPTVLIRGPYVRQGGFLGPLFAERGYQVLLQDVRGTGGSLGTFDPFRQEKEDGLDTLEWLEKQPWYSGDVVTFGSSYLGFVQWAIAAEAGPRLGAMSVQITFSDLYDAIFPGGALALQTFMGWVSVIDNPSLLGMVPRIITGNRKLNRALNQLPLSEVDTAATGHKVPYYQEWLQHDSPDDVYWVPASFSEKIGKVSSPVHLLGGWYDFFLPSMVHDYQTLRKAGKQPYLTIGPWAHSDFALNKVALKEALAFFDAHIKGKTSNLRDQPVLIWVSGAEEWRHYPDFPPPGTQPQHWYLQAGGVLAPNLPDDSAPDTYCYDPAHPTPSKGGPLGPGIRVGAGPVANSSLEARHDVLVYTTSPLEHELETIGPVYAELFVQSNREYTDFFVRLCDVDPSGTSTNVCDSLLRVAPGHPAPQKDGTLHLKINLWPAAHLFCCRHSIRLQLSSGSFPRYARNLGSGEPLIRAKTLQIAEQSVYHDPHRPSAVILPVQG